MHQTQIQTKSSPLPKVKDKSIVVPENYKLNYSNDWVQTITISIDENITSKHYLSKINESRILAKLEKSRKELREGKGKVLKSLKELR